MDAIRDLSSINDINAVKDKMHADILSMLQDYEFIDEYDGYQRVADIWNGSLTHDSEMIADGGFYHVGRMREPHMVTKGSGKNKREEQDGWKGVIVPNEIIKKCLYKDAVNLINKDKNRLQETEEELIQLAESAMEEDTLENEALFETLKKNADGDAQAIFESKAVKSELKQSDKHTQRFELLKKVESLISEKTTLAKKIKDAEISLAKEIEDRIEKLTDAEIDELMHVKWFGTFVEDIAELATHKLKDEIETLKMLHHRYDQTMDSIDEEIKELMNTFSLLQQDLVVM